MTARLSSLEHHTAGEPLTQRQCETLALLAVGHSNKMAARLLGVSVRTVENHRLSFRRKLGSRNNHDLYVQAGQLGLLPHQTRRSDAGSIPSDPSSDQGCDTAGSAAHRDTDAAGPATRALRFGASRGGVTASAAVPTTQTGTCSARDGTTCGLVGGTSALASVKTPVTVGGDESGTAAQFSVNHAGPLA